MIDESEPADADAACDRDAQTEDNEGQEFDPGHVDPVQPCRAPVGVGIGMPGIKLPIPVRIGLLTVGVAPPLIQ